MTSSSTRARLSRAASSRDTHSLRIAVPDMDGSSEGRPRELHVLFASTGCTDPKIIDDFLPRLADLPDVSLRAVLDTGFRGQDIIRASSHCLTVPNTARGSQVANEDVEQEAAELCEWANLLVLGPVDANTLAKMLHGQTDNLLLEILRSWNVSKKILLVPGMSSLMWENPTTKKQLTKIRRKWNWIQVLPPLLWNFHSGKKDIVSWEATDELVDAVRNQVDLMNIGHGMDVSPASRATPFTAPSHPHSATKKTPTALLPPELWTIIFDFTADWELAQTLHIYTNLPPPADWTSHTSPQGPRNYMEALELTTLRGNLADVKHFIATHSVPRWLSKLCIKLIMRFALTPLLAHLEANHKDLFWATFGHTFLPDKASSVFGRTEILEFWRTSPSFLTKEWNAEALDGASRAGFVHVLEWWQESGLPLKYTEAALEQASSQGHVAVLEWWKAQSTSPATTSPSPSSTNANAEDPNNQLIPPYPHRRPPIVLKPGKSICYATQNGHTPVINWWLHSSSTAFSHEDTVAKLASTHGHVSILQLWHAHKGSKMIFDNQVLVGATKGGWVGVLEWWKMSGLRVEYKTCDVEEALEDGVEGERGVEVRRWWARNGLNLGVGTSKRCYRSEIRLENFYIQQDTDADAYYAAYGTSQERYLVSLLARIDIVALTAAASKARDGVPCTVPALLRTSEQDFNLDLIQAQMGGQNFHVDVEFEDGVVWLARIRLDDPLLPPKATQTYILESEVATLKFLEKTAVPAPRVYAYAVESEANPVGAPYMFTERLPGVPLDWDEASTEQKSRVIAQLADIFLELEQHPLPKCGSLCIGPDGDEVSGFAQVPLFTSPQVTLGPFDNEASCSHALIGHQQRQIVSGELSSLAVDNYLTHCWRNEMVADVAIYCQDSGAADFFFLKHYDDKGDHIFVDADFNITGIIDWEFASTETKAFAFSTPSMLWPVADFYDGKNELSADEVEFANAFEARGRGDLARIVRESREMQRFMFFNGGGMSRDGGEFRNLFQGLRAAWARKGKRLSAYEDWKREASQRYSSDEGLRSLQRRTGSSG